ncbi:hypothetical protein KY290_017445 [Solanum tuberosum]|uniref:Uncharacterized protein n=1 Tax=Solanum tuberosum TaxID=4113 RepID=A0ABQ7VBA3_SOLTU|nr:hypothetical protein KY290_017445 [Solanum tuberosum]
MDEKGQFKEILCMNNIKGVLSLYEASYLSTKDESIMDMAQKFSIHNMKKYLKQKMDDHDKNNILVKQVSHALEMPLHWKVQRLEARWFIDNVYEQSECFNPILLQLAKLDFNMLQAIYLDELKQLSSLAYDILKEQAINILSFLRKSWIELFKTYLMDAKWYYEYDNKYTPSFKEFLDHGWVSIGGPLVIKLFYICTMNNPIKKDDLELLEQNPPLIQLPSLIGRLEDDLATSPDEIKRGDAPKSIQCYMMETKSSEENARDYMKELIGQTWKKMNKEVVMDNTTSFSKDFVRIAMNFARGAQHNACTNTGIGMVNQTGRLRGAYYQYFLNQFLFDKF